MVIVLFCNFQNAFINIKYICLTTKQFDTIIINNYIYWYMRDTLFIVYKNKAIYLDWTNFRTLRLKDCTIDLISIITSSRWSSQMTKNRSIIDVEMWETEEGCVLRGPFLWFISLHSHYLHLSNHHSYQVWKNNKGVSLIAESLHLVTDHQSPRLSGSHLLQY